MLLMLQGDEFRDDVRVLFNDGEVPGLSSNWREILLEARVTGGDLSAQPLVMPAAQLAPGIYTVANPGYSSCLRWVRCCCR